MLVSKQQYQTLQLQQGMQNLQLCQTHTNILKPNKCTVYNVHKQKLA